MASGHLQGRMLKMFVRMIRPRQVLELSLIHIFQQIDPYQRRRMAVDEGFCFFFQCFLREMCIRDSFYSLQRSEMEKQMAVIEKEKALYQFEVLKNQINPHFLFNSLNVLASLAYQDTEKTNRFAKKLSTV